MERPRAVRTRTEKWCPGCKIVLPVEDFHLDKTRPDGREGYCKVCKSKRRRDRTNG